MERALPSPAAATRLVESAARMEVAISADMASMMLSHLELLAQWNRKLNLTAITDPERMRAEHVLDSLSVLPWLRGNQILDIGSGGGFPGLPLAIAAPERSFTLLDSRGKRVEFLRYVVGRLGLDNVTLVNERVEKYRPAVKFDTLVCRAFASLGDILALTRNLQSPGAQLLAMKAHLSDAERESVGDADLIALDVDGLAAARQLVRIRFAES